MHRWFRFCAGFALISFAGVGHPVYAEPEVAAPQAVVEEDDIAQAIPPAGKHQLRPTPMQIAEYRIELLSKRLAERDPTAHGVDGGTGETDRSTSRGNRFPERKS
jgi:hypothetical protein